MPTDIAPCPKCNPSGNSPTAGKLANGNNQVVDCPLCDGQGAVSTKFPVPFHYVFPLTVDSVKGGQFQKQISNEADFRWIYTLLDVPPPGDARFVQLQLQDLSSNFNFSSDFVDALSFAGTGQLPFAILEPYDFGKNTQLLISAKATILGPFTQVFAVADGVLATFTGMLQAPVLPGSLTVTDPPGVVVGTDDGNGGITGAGITAGSINYQTGQISITYTVVPAAGNKITAVYQVGIKTNVIQVTLWGFLMVGKQGVGASNPPTNT